MLSLLMSQVFIQYQCASKFIGNKDKKMKVFAVSDKKIMVFLMVSTVISTSPPSVPAHPPHSTDGKKTATLPQGAMHSPAPSAASLIVALHNLF